MAATNGMDAHAQDVAATAAAEPREQGSSQVTPSARVRHVVSLHLRNFRSLTESKHKSDNHATQLYRLSLGISPSDGRAAYLTEVSPPAINADWSLRLDQTQASTSKQTTDAQRMWLGQTHFNVALWAARDDGNAEWQCSQDVKVDLRRMERISGGLSSAFMSKLPANSLVVGIRTSVWSHTRSGHTQQPDELKRQDKDTSAEDVSGRLATDARAHDAVTYYFVPPTNQIQRHHSSRSRVSSGKGRTLRESTSSSHLDHEADVSMASGAGSDPEDSFNQSAEEEEGGYDSETAYELSTSNSSRMGDSVGRPGLDRRRSSNRTIRTLKRDRRPRASSKASSKKRMSADGTDDTSTTSAGPSSEGQGSRLRDLERDLDRRRQVQRWQVEREREQEVLERSKWETRMLHSYDREKLRTLLERQAATTALCREINDVRSRLNPSLTQGNSIVALRRQASNTRGRLTALEELVERDEGKVKQLRGELQNRREALARRRARLDFVRRQMAEDATDVPGVHQELQVMRSSLHRSSAFLHNRRAHMLEALSLIYAINLLSPADLLFSICGLPLPNSPAEALTDGHSDSVHSGKVDEEQIAAALGMAAQLVLLLATYLDTPLHYEIATAGSRAMIRDGISLMNGPRSFPLYSKGVELYRFEYGVFLLNKNIEQLMNVHGLPVLDLRHVLPNLNNLMLTLSSPIAVPPKSDTPDVEPTDSNGTLARAPKLHSYRTAGKGEIILSSSISQQPANLDGEADVSGGKREDGRDKDAAHVPTFKEAVKVKRSPAASWTASLLGWKGGRRPSTSSVSSKDVGASMVAAESEGGVTDAPHRH